MLEQPYDSLSNTITLFEKRNNPNHLDGVSQLKRAVRVPVWAKRLQRRRLIETMAHYQAGNVRKAMSILIECREEGVGFHRNDIV